MKKVYLIAVVFALLAGFATYMFADTIDKKTSFKDANTTPVYVALQEIPKNTQITEEMLAEDAGYFQVKEVVDDYLVANVVTAEEKDQLVNYITVDPVYVGDQISKSRLISADEDSVSLSFKLDEGMVAYSFSSGGVNGVDGYICEGDTVDIIVGNKVVYKDLKILRVSNASDQQAASASGAAITTYSSLTVQVTEEQALQLYKIENGTEGYKLLLKPRGAMEKADNAQNADNAAADNTAEAAANN